MSCARRTSDVHHRKNDRRGKAVRCRNDRTRVFRLRRWKLFPFPQHHRDDSCCENPSPYDHCVRRMSDALHRKNARRDKADRCWNGCIRVFRLRRLNCRLQQLILLCRQHRKLCCLHKSRLSRWTYSGYDRQCGWYVWLS